VKKAMKKRIKVLILRPELGGLVEIDNSLDALHDIIGDDIESITLRCGCVMYVGENGKLREPMPPFNPAATAIYAYDCRVIDDIRGTAIILNVNGDAETDLDDGRADHYSTIARAAYLTYKINQFNAEEDEPHDRDID
jgi:hypothetical protein